MALNAYITALQVLLHDQAGLAYPQAVLTGFINEARQQVALEGECINGVGWTTIMPGSVVCGVPIQNSSVQPPLQPPGVGNLATPKSIQFDPGTVLTSGAKPLVTLEKRGWDWFNFYWLGLAAPPPGPPRCWCPLNQGVATLPQGGVGWSVATGSFYVNPPNTTYTLLINGLWSPLDLMGDGDPEAIPGPWTDAVPHYALYLAFKDARLQSLAQQAMQEFELMMGRARAIVTPLREQQVFPGGLAARRLPGEAPPQRGAGAGQPPAAAAPQQGGG
jgi:hypothetical protein